MSTDPFDAIRSNFIGRLDDTPPLSFSIQAGILIGLSVLIAALSLSLFVRLFKETGRISSTEENGIFHVHVSMVAQFLTGIYAVRDARVCLSGYLTTEYTTPPHLTLQLVSPLLLYLSFLVLLHSLVLQPFYNPLLRSFPSSPTSLTDLWEMSHALKLRQQRKRSRKINIVSFFGVLFLLIAPIITTIFLVKEWKQLKEVIRQSIEWTNGVESSRSQLNSIQLGELTAEGLDHEKTVGRVVRIWSGCWLITIMTGLAIFIPTVFYLLTTLRHRRAALGQALYRLGTNRERSDSVTLDDGASKTGSEGTTLANKMHEELRDRLQRTDETIKRTYLRCFITLPILASYFALHSYIIKHFYPDSSSLFTTTLWTSWTITPLSLFATTIFSYRTFFSRLPVLTPSTKILNPSPRYRSSRGADSTSQRGLTSNFDAQSTTSSTYASTFPSSFHSRSTSFSTNANITPFEPVEIYRPRQPFSYPPASASLARKKSQDTLSKIPRKVVPVNEEGGRAGEEGENEEVESSSHHGSVWTEEIPRR
ncbi:hypothetical protein JCM16303_001816 [Sporobolomyces ruberrimus]